MKTSSHTTARRFIAALIAMLAAISGVASDTIPSGFSLPPLWSVGAEISPFRVIPTNGFIKGDNPEGKRIEAGFAAAMRIGFIFNGRSREGMLYKGLYQGIAIGALSFSPAPALGTPMSAYVYQGAPIARLGRKLSLGYEWKFGAAFGWKHRDLGEEMHNDPVSTPVTAMMGLALKLSYRASDRCLISFGIEAEHFSNGNTSLPNAGVNTALASIGVSYSFSGRPESGTPPAALASDADRGKWIFDIMAYGAWRRRVVSVGDPAQPQMCPGKFGVAGMQLSPMRRLNRWISAGPSLDVQWDEGGGLEPYWVEGTSEECIKFFRPPFCKQIKAGISARAELTMPIFHINAGIGYDLINPKGDMRLYQTLALKTFVARNIYINVGYRLGNFSDPENLMLGLGITL